MPSVYTLVGAAAILASTLVTDTTASLALPLRGSERQLVKHNKGMGGDKETGKDKGKDKKFTVGDLQIDIKGQSGKVGVKRMGMGKKKNTASNVIIEMDSLTEVSESGQEVGKTGKVKHSFKSFATQEFSYTVEDLTEKKIDENSTATAAKIKFESTIQTGSKLAVETYLVKKAGEVGTPTEKWSVQPGDMKFNILMTDWVWCEASTCKEGAGKFIDLDIEIKGKKDKPEKKDEASGATSKNATKKKKAKKYSLGDGASLDLSSLVKLDGNWTTMPDGYPKLVTKGGKQIYTFRFPRFKSAAFYDPVIGFDSSVEASADEDSASSASGGALPIVAAAASIFSVWLVM